MVKRLITGQKAARQQHYPAKIGQQIDGMIISPTMTQQVILRMKPGATNVELKLSDTVPDLDVSSVSTGMQSKDSEKKVVDLQQLLESGEHQEVISKLKSAIIAAPRKPGIALLSWSRLPSLR